MNRIGSAVAAAFILAGTALAPLAVQAHELTMAECSEGSDFIKNAALSRDVGLKEKVFIAQFEADVQALKRLPAELRWFVQDKDDEDFLLQAVQDVFQRPKAAAVHQAQFAVACVRRIQEGPDVGVRI